MSSKRQQIDEYFLNPVPSAGKMLDSEGLDQDDGDRMQAYFNKSGVEDFVPAESNRRTILPEIEMPDEAYRSKKVHRKDLEQKVSSSEEDEEGNSEEGEAEISEEALEESQESELSEEIIPVISGILQVIPKGQGRDICVFLSVFFYPHHVLSQYLIQYIFFN